MYKKCKFLFMILDSDLSNGWYVTTKRITIFGIMSIIKIVVVKFTFFHLIVNKSFWVASLEEP